MRSFGWKKLRSRICCAVLAVAMIIGEVPMSVYAQEIDVNSITEDEVIEQQLQDEDTSDTVLEDDSDNSDSDVLIDEEDSEDVDESTSESVVEEDIAESASEEDEEDAPESVPEENDIEEIVTEEEAVSEEKLNAETSGVFGDVEWSVVLNDNMTTRTLTIKPKDGLTDVTIDNTSYMNYPWHTYVTSVTKAVIMPGIKNIPTGCFQGFNLREVDMPDSIEVIGKGAFQYCHMLGFSGVIHFPDELRIIEESAFYGCDYLGEVILPSHLEKIEKKAFGDNDGIHHISIPASVTEIAEGFLTSKAALSRWNLRVDVDEANPYYSVEDGILYKNSTNTAMLCFGQDTSMMDGVITLRPGTQRIADSAFRYMKWHPFKVEMPDSVISIGAHAFSESYISKIKVSENLKHIGESAFSFCEYLKDFDFPDSVRYVEINVFQATNITELKFPKYMDEIPEGMYANTLVRTERTVYIPSGIEVIGQFAFADSKVGTVYIPKSVKTIKDGAFDCNYIDDIYYGGTEEEWKELLNSHVEIDWVRGANIHYYTDLVDLKFKDGIITSDGQLKSGINFGDIAFKEHDAVKEVRFSDWSNRYGTSMRSTDKVDQNNEYFAYVSITTDSFFSEATKVTVNREECEVFDISADGKRISFVTPTYFSDCKHSRVDFNSYESDGEKHWHSCPDCGIRVRESVHTWGPDVLNAGVTTTECTTCHFEVTKTNGRMRMNKTQISGGYYEMGEAIPTSFSMDKSYAYSSCYELSEPVWYKGAYSESNKINANQGLRFQNDTYYVEFEIAIKEELANQYYLKSGGITVRFVNSALSEVTDYRNVREDPNVAGRQIQKVVFSYRPIDRSDLTVVLPTYLSSMTVSQFKQKVKFMSGGQEITPMTTPAVYDIYGQALNDSAIFSLYTPYIIQPMIDVPGYVDESSIKGLGILGCRPDSIFNYRPEDNKTGVIPKITFCFNPKAIAVANVDVEAPLVGEKLGENVFARENNLFEITSKKWFDKEGQEISADHIAEINNSYGIIVNLAPKGQAAFSEKTIFTINGYRPTQTTYIDEGSAMLIYEFPPVEEHIHIPVLVPMDPGNCSNKGHVEYYQCNECGRSYLDKELTQRITNLSVWLNNYNNGLDGGMIQDTSIHNFIFETNNSSVDRCQDCGIKNINFMGLKVNVAEAMYTGNLVDAPISIEGLSFGTDYYISEGADAINPGVYKAVIEGRNSYGGQRTVFWTLLTDGMYISFMDANNAEYEYTGKQIKPSVIVYDGFKRLTAGKDYTISYKNNVNAYTLRTGEPGFVESKAPTVIVTGKGNYSGKETANFVINPKSIDSVKVDDIYVNATGKPITVKPVVKLGSKTLVLNKDYSIYSTSNLYEKLQTVTTQGRHELLVKGTGNYQGSSIFYFDVTDKLLIKKCSITVKNAEYDNGRIVKPEVTVKYQGKVLTMGTDYNLDLTDRAIGNATVKIIGTGAYTGVVSKAFKITGVPISTVKVAPVESTEYSGYNHWPIMNLTYEKKGEAPVKLEINKDYKVNFTNNKNVGTGKAVVTGLGKYTGTRTVTFKITPMDVDTYGYRIAINANCTINEIYVAGGVKPDLPVTFNGELLKKGVDYTCTYSNNTSVGNESDVKAPTIKYTFKGNFKGTITKKFNITKSLIYDLDVTVPNVAYNSKANGWISKPVIKDANGKTLVAGRDYKVSYYSDPYYNIPATDQSNVHDALIRVKIEGLEPYAGEVKKSYRIVNGNIANAQVNIANIEYDPEGLATVNKSDIKISCNGVDLQSSDYTISSVKMPKNNKLGTGTVVLQASEVNYTGTKTVKFKVVPRTTSDTNRNKVYILEDPGYIYYKKSGSKKGIRVMYADSYGLNAKWIKEGVDYTISYTNVGKAASRADAKAPTVTVNFKGKFKGKQTLKYDIIKQNLGYGDIYNSDVIYNSNPGGWKQTKFTFKDIEGNVLKQGVDYELVPGYYIDSDCTQPFTDSQNIVGKDVYFKLAAKPESNYGGEWIGSYKIVTGDISKAKVTVKNTKSWTGDFVNLVPSDIDVNLNGTSLVEGRDWEIVVCRNNVNRGTATVEIRGIGDYGGTKTANFKIVQKIFRWWNR